MPQLNPQTVHLPIPRVVCPSCRTAMRLAYVEPAVTRPSGKDTLIYECESCDYTHNTPVREDSRVSHC